MLPLVLSRKISLRSHTETITEGKPFFENSRRFARKGLFWNEN